MLRASVVIALLLGSGCTEAAPCTTDADCASGLACVEQRCRAAVRTDAGSDSGGPIDGGRDSGGPIDAGRDSGSADGGGSDAGEPECETGGRVPCPERLECRAIDSALACLTGAPGRCIDPDVTAGESGPQCGCDGWSYASGVRRFEAGAAFAHSGFCTCEECAVGGVCDRGLTCADSAAGVCVSPPSACGTAATDVLSWSCTGDSPTPTFANECERLAAGAPLASPAPLSCPGAAPGPGCCFTDADCILTGDGLCYGSTGCDASTGVCLAISSATECFGARDCPPGYACAGAVITPCSSSRSSAGHCEVRAEGLR